MQNTRRFLKKLRMELPYDPAIPLMGICLKNMKTLIQKDIYTFTFTEVLFKIGKTRKQPTGPLMDEWMNKIWYIFTIEYYSVIKKTESCHLQ